MNDNLPHNDGPTWNLRPLAFGAALILLVLLPAGLTAYRLVQCWLGNAVCP